MGASETHAHLHTHIFLQNITNKSLKKTIRWLECVREVVGSRGQAIEKEVSSGDRKAASTGWGGRGGRGEGKERELEFKKIVLKTEKKKKTCIHRTFQRQEEPLI